MRLGVLGVGRIGVMHAANAAASPAVERVTVFDADGARAAQVAAELGVASATDLQGLLAEVDGVLVATPSPTHPEVVRTALAAGVPVLCEKPLALDPEVVRELAAAADVAGVPLVVGFQRRFDPALRAMRAAIAAGEYGDVYLARAIALDHAPPPMSYVATSGGMFVDQLIHDLDALPWLVGQPVVRVQATGSVLVDPGFADAGDVDTSAVVLTFASGALGVLTAARANGGGYDNRIEITAQKASVTAGLDARTPLTSLEAGVPAPRDPYPGFLERFATAYAAEVAAFADIAAGRAENPSPALDSLVALQLAEACRTSVREGRAVDLEPLAAGAGS
jgi:myo-inositol 2-dehydrogenase/D-chiro-inositol 1-dehydrogenase